MTCELCQGKRHVYDTDRGWVRCQCLLRKQTDQRREEAMISTRYDDETWRSFATSHKTEGLKELLREVKLLKNGKRSEGWFMIHGRPSRARDLCTTLVLRSACEGGFIAAQTDLPSLIDVEFDRESDKGIYYTEVLAVRAGSEPRHAWNKHVMQKLIRARWDHRLFTVIVAEADPGRLIEFYKVGMVQEALRSRFHRVSVEAK